MYRVKELAARLSLSISKVYQLIRSGEMPHFKIGGAVRVSEEQFEKFLAGAIREREELKPVPNPSRPKLRHIILR